MAFPVARALDQAGHRVFAGVSKFSNYLEWSRHIAGSFRHPPLEPGTDDALPYILDWLSEHGPVDAIQPVSEAGSRFLTRHRAQFERLSQLIMPDAQTVAACMDKPGLFDLCAALGVALAPYERVRSLVELKAAASRIGFPLIVKPAVVDAELFGRKALIVQDAAGLEAVMPDWPAIHPELIVQSYVSGPRHSVIFSADRGRLLRAVEIRAARTHVDDGTGYTTYGETVVPTPLVAEGVERLVSHLGYTSTGCAQFIVSPTGRVTFMEINPRVSLGRIAECAGLPHSVWGLQLALGETVDPQQPPWTYRRGVRYVWTKGDLGLLAKQIAGGKSRPLASLATLWTIASDALRCTHAIFDPADPLPAIGTYGNVFLRHFRNHPEYRLADPEAGSLSSLARAGRSRKPFARPSPSGTPAS
ncbi:hypothetical protein GCM10009116_19310 [Brevundimonas basaltis]